LITWYPFPVDASFPSARPPLPPAFLAFQAVQMFLEEKIHYLDIVKLNEACCDAHQTDLIALPNLEEIVHYDQWARR